MIDPADVAAALAAVLDRPVGYVDVPPDQAVPAMVAAGLPPFAAEQIGHVFAALRGGAQTEVVGDIEALVSRPARTVQDFLAVHADAFGGTVRQSA